MPVFRAIPCFSFCHPRLCFECRHHPEFLQTETEQHQSSPLPPPGDGDDDLDLPEAFAYEEDDVTADFGFLDRGDPDPFSGAGVKSHGEWIDFKPADNGTESQPKKVPFQGTNNEYCAC